MRNLQSYEESRFWSRLDATGGDASFCGDKRAVRHLIDSVGRVADQAKWISTQICRYMPQYTLHEERHILNVLAIMDTLVPDRVMGQLTPLECCLPILAAYTHDLGMALSPQEFDGLHDESTDLGRHFHSYRSRFDEELRQIERWKKQYEVLAPKRDKTSRQDAAECRKRFDSIEGHILSSYVRDTHTEDDFNRRLRRWLEAIRKESGDEDLFRYGNFDYQRTLALIAVSHGRGAPWLRRQLNEAGADDRFFQPVATGESANLAFPGLLLRLADVMDFDASRAPRILFKHFGIENDKSVLEWNKHQSVIGWTLDVDPTGREQPQLRYAAECQHPVHEKAIREFAGWIDSELSAVRIELDAQRRRLPAAAQDRYDLHLSSQTRLDIRAARDPLTDQPKYVYHDLQFRLDQDEIQQLLMGESLYGDPGLCIRELLQNALDALELRELRLKMKQKGEAREPVDGELIRPGWVREPDGREEELRVTLDWGTDEETGQQWLRVTDNGVGMTEEVIKRYFTQIGKSYYRSPEFNQERAAMKAAGEIVSPISIFGIGILSCFMIGDRLIVRTCAGTSDGPTRSAIDVSISGPGSLFWLQPGTLNHPGTEILLFLKRRFRLHYEPMRLLDELEKKFPYTLDRRLFGYEIEELLDDDGVEENDVRPIDPVLDAAGNAAWTRYPIVVRSETCPEIRLDEDFQRKRVSTIRSHDVYSKAGEWNCSEEWIDAPTWRHWEWQDSLGPDATGSRIRLWFPQHRSLAEGNPLPVDSDSNLCTYAELASFVEPQLPAKGRTIVFVKGMYIPDARVCNRFLPIAENVGTMLWIDLRGSAAPKLKADRSKALFPTEAAAWKKTLASLVERFRVATNEVSNAIRPSVRNNMRQSLVWPNGGQGHRETTARNSFELLSALSPSWAPKAHRLSVELASHRLLQEQSLSRQYIKVFFRREQADKVRDYGLTTDLQFGEVNLHDEADYYLREHCFDIRQIVDDSREFKRDSSLKSFAIILYQQLLHCPFDVDVIAAFVSPRLAPDVCLHASALQEAFFPKLQTSWPPLGLCDLSGWIGDATLLGPTFVEFNFEDDGRRVEFADPQGDAPAELVGRGYDLTFPMTAVPLGQLRRECANWRTDRELRPLGVAPFLLPALHDVWCEHAEFLQETFGVPHIYCLLPRFELWSKRFSDWNDDDWNHPENLSALWDLSGRLTGKPGQVLWARGAHDIDTVSRIGRPAPEFLESTER